MNNKHILVVDDSVDTRDLYQEVLQDAGFDVNTVIDGQEALLEVKKDIYDLILLDIMMPVFNGVEFLKQLKTVVITKPPCIVLLTNLAHEQVIHEALLLGAHSYLIKSELTPLSLVEHVKDVLHLK